MTSQKNLKLIMASLLAAMTCIATMIISIPTPTNGYIHLGDGLVLLCGIILGPMYGGMAAGIGSMFSDILLGYTYYALPTFIIKAFAAVTGGFIYQKFSKTISRKGYLLPLVSAGIAGGIIVTSGYFLVEATIFGYGIAAASSIPGNLLQNLFGIIVSALLMPTLSHIPVVRSLMIKKA